MGKIKKKRPRRGSLQYWPRKRARRQTPIIKSWPVSQEVKPLGFLGYKAGMSKIFLIDNRKNSPTKGEELARAVTIIETPPLRVFGIKLYKQTNDGLKCIGEAWSEKLDKELSRISDLVNHALLFLDGSEIQEKCEKDYNVMVEILTDLRSTIEQIRRELKDE